ncbi:MAG: STAS domain-containing protein [Rhodocyclaceae bacterium]|nr:STAS domain-containing protein [Rhodocyclaceae bacterium]
MQIAIHITGDRAVLQLKDRFDWSSQNEFRDAVDTVLNDFGTNEIQVDLGGVNYIDSTALGLLLVLRDEARARNKSVSLANCRGSVKAVLDIAKFDRIFPLS